MGNWLRGRLTFANVVSVIALFAALGLGTAWALAPDSVKSKHIVNGQVKTKDLADNAVNAAKLGDDSVGLRHMEGVSSTVLSNWDVAAGACFNQVLFAPQLEADDGFLVIPRRRDGADPSWDPRLVLDGYGPKAPTADETNAGLPGYTVRVCNISNEAVEDARLSFYTVALR